MSEKTAGNSLSVWDMRKIAPQFANHKGDTLQNPFVTLHAMGDGTFFSVLNVPTENDPCFLDPGVKEASDKGMLFCNVGPGANTEFFNSIIAGLESGIVDIREVIEQTLKKCLYNN